MTSPVSQPGLVPGWQESVFNVRVEGTEGKTLIFNTLTQKVVELGRDLPEAVQRRPALLSSLSDWGLLVPHGTTTDDEYRAFFTKRSRPSKTLTLILTTATSCNLACSYCFENRVRRTEMPESVLKTTTDWIDTRVRERGIEHISLTLFGGEPLLAPDRAFQCLEAIRETCRTSPATLEYVLLTTNGLHGDESMLEDLASAGVTAAQITFDGDHLTNNARRRGRKNLLAGADVYESIMANLRSYARIFDLTVKVNFDKSTIESVPRLFDDLEAVAKLDPSTYRVKIEPIAIWKPAGSRQNSEETLYDSSGTELAGAFQQLITVARERKIRLDLSAVFPTPCMVSGPDSFLIEPDGKLRSCISAFGMDEFYVGTVSEPINIEAERAGRAVTGPETQDLAKCLERNCSYLPVCDGGCKYEVHLQGLPTNRMQCKIPYFDEVIPVYAQAKNESRSVRYRVA